MSDRRTTRDLALAALMTALVGVGAYLSIPLYGGIPFTLQVLFVLLAGLVLGSRLAMLSMIAYVLIGLIAPVYAGGTSGLGILFGPPGGYIWGFVVAAWLVGLLVERTGVRSVAGYAIVSLAGLIPIYLLGASWLAIQLHTTGFNVVIWGGVLQFLPGDVLKAVAAALAMRSLAATPVHLPALSARRR